MLRRSRRGERLSSEGRWQGDLGRAGIRNPPGSGIFRETRAAGCERVCLDRTLRDATSVCATACAWRMPAAGDRGVPGRVLKIQYIDRHATLLFSFTAQIRWAEPKISGLHISPPRTLSTDSEGASPVGEGLRRRRHPQRDEWPRGNLWARTTSGWGDPHRAAGAGMNG